MAPMWGGASPLQGPQGGGDSMAFRPAVEPPWGLGRRTQRCSEWPHSRSAGGSAFGRTARDGQGPAPRGPPGGAGNRTLSSRTGPLRDVGRGVTRIDSHLRTELQGAQRAWARGAVQRERLTRRPRGEAQGSRGSGLAEGSTGGRPRAELAESGAGCLPGTRKALQQPVSLWLQAAALPSPEATFLLPAGLRDLAGEPSCQRLTHITAEPGALKWLRHGANTLLSFCHLLLSLKNYISICFHAFLPSQPPLPEAHSTSPLVMGRNVPSPPGSWGRLGDTPGVGDTPGGGVTGLLGGQSPLRSPRTARPAPRPANAHFGGSHLQSVLLLVLIGTHDFAIKSK